MGLFKSPERKAKDDAEEKKAKEIPYVFDQVKRDEEARDGYCQKCKRESIWCKERCNREEPKKQHSQAVTTSQAYGWREPLDDLASPYKRSAVCKRTFFDSGHL